MHFEIHIYTLRFHVISDRGHFTCVADIFHREKISFRRKFRLGYIYVGKVTKKYFDQRG